MGSTLHLEKAEALFDLGRYRAAIGEIGEHLACEPQDASAHALLAISLARLRRLGEAAESIQTAINLAPDQPYVFRSACIVCAIRGELRTAEQAIREALRLDSRDAHSHYLLAWVLNAREKWKDSLRACDDAIAINPNDADYLVLRGKVFWQLGKLKQAEEAFREALRCDAENPDAHESRGRVLLAQEEPSQALPHFMEARRLSPVEKENLLWIAEAVGQQFVLFRVLNTVKCQWYHWHWLAIWVLFLSCSALLMWIYRSVANGDLPAWTVPALGLVIANWTCLPITTRFSALALGSVVTSRRKWNKVVLGIAYGTASCLFVAGHAIVSILAVQWPLTVLAGCMFVACFSSMGYLAQSLRDQANILPYLGCFIIPFMLGCGTMATFINRQAHFEGLAITFVFASLVANLLGGYFPTLWKPKR